MLPELREKIEQAATAAGRSMNAEVVHRLQQSFNPPTGDAEVLRAELEQLRALVNDFRSTADSSDAMRALLAEILVIVLAKVPDKAFTDLEDGVFRITADWLNERDRRGAAFSLLRLLEKATPQTIEAVQRFTSHLEDLDMYSKPITLVRSGEKTKKAPKRSGSVNKVILVGNLGRDPEVQYMPTIERTGVAARKANKGPERSPNARKPLPKK